jgi:large subunit ribosomal protein L25
MQNVQLKATPRAEYGKGPAHRLRRSGRLPVVAYGAGGSSVSLAVASHQVRDILLSHRGRNTIIDLDIDGGERFAVMIRDYAVHPVSRELLHADFVRVDTTKPITLEVPFRTTGRAKGELEGGTVLVTERMVPVRCMPENIPNWIEHDVTELLLDHVVRVREVAVPPNVEILLPPDRKIIVCKPPKIEVEEKPAVEGEAAAAPAEGAAAPAEGAAPEGAAAPAKADKPAKGDKK